MANLIKMHGSDNNKRLLQLLRKKDKYTLKQLYDYYFPLLYRKIYDIVKNDETAEELAHDTFMKFLKIIETAEPDSVTALLYVIARTTALDHYRKESKKRAKEKAYRKLHASQRPDEAGDIEDEIWEKLWLQAKKLSPLRRKILEEHYKNKKSVEVIAREMNLAPQTVRNQLALATKDLKKTMPEDIFLFWTLICVFGKDFL